MVAPVNNANVNNSAKFRNIHLYGEFTLHVVATIWGEIIW